MTTSQDVQSLYRVCDNIDSGLGLQFRKLNALELSRLIQNESLAFQQPNSPLFAELANLFVKAQQTGAWVTSQGYSPDPTVLVDLIRQWFILVDEIFFFETLTREINTRQGRQHTLGLHIEDTISDPQKPPMYGLFDIPKREVTLWLQNSNFGIGGNVRTLIEQLLYTVTHESVHAFLWLFSNRDAELHNEWVNQGNGHGTMFKEILGVLVDKIEIIIRSYGFEADKWRAACYQDESGCGVRIPLTSLGECTEFYVPPDHCCFYPPSSFAS